MTTEKDTLKQLAAQIEKLMADANVGGSCLLIGKDVATSFIYLPKWVNLHFLEPSDENETIHFKEAEDESMILNTLYFFSVTKAFLKQTTETVLNKIPEYFSIFKAEINQIAKKEKNPKIFH